MLLLSDGGALANAFADEPIEVVIRKVGREISMERRGAPWPRVRMTACEHVVEDQILGLEGWQREKSSEKVSSLLEEALAVEDCRDINHRSEQVRRTAIPCNRTGIRCVSFADPCQKRLADLFTVTGGE
jgi:hypothetical protein